MKINAFGRGAALAALYIGILLGLIVWQFPTSGAFTLNSGNMTLKGEKGEQEGSLTSGALSFGGLTLQFSPSKPVRWTAQNGQNMISVPQSFKTTENGFVVAFTEDLELHAYSSKEPSSNAGFEFLRDSGTPKDVIVSVSATRQARIAQEGKAYFADGSAGRYLIEVPDGSMSPDHRSIDLPLLRGHIAPVLLSKAEEETSATSVRFMEQAAMDPAVFKSAISDYRDKVWKGLSSGRFVPETVQWKNVSGNAAFSEAALTVYLAEAWSRGVGTSALERVSSANTLHPSSLTYLSVPFLGHTTARMKAFEESDMVEIKRVEKLVQDKSPALLEKPNLVHFLLDRAPYSLAQDAFLVVQNMDLGSLSTAQTVGGLAAWAEGEDLFTSEENPFAKFAGIAEKEILPSVVKAGEGFFLTTASDGSCVLATSIRAGWALIRLGESTGKTMFTGIGQSLVLGALQLADDSGFLPKTVVVRNGSIVSRTDTLSPEDAYPLVAGNPYYPHEVSFFKEAGPGAWIWTCSPSVTVSATPERMIWSMEFPEQGVHYLAAYGVKPFTTMQLYGLNYPMDPDFENYNASGYLYRRASNVVYFKMRHKSKTEEIRMIY
jgi:hypothetical protein